MADIPERLCGAGWALAPACPMVERALASTMLSSSPPAAASRGWTWPPTVLLQCALSGTCHEEERQQVMHVVFLLCAGSVRA